MQQQLTNKQLDTLFLIRAVDEFYQSDDNDGTFETLEDAIHAFSHNFNTEELANFARNCAILTRYKFIESNAGENFLDIIGDDFPYVPGVTKITFEGNQYMDIANEMIEHDEELTEAIYEENILKIKNLLNIETLFKIENNFSLINAEIAGLDTVKDIYNFLKNSIDKLSSGGVAIYRKFKDFLGILK